MKTIKIALVAALVVALGGGVAYLILNNPSNTGGMSSESTVAMPEGCEFGNFLVAQMQKSFDSVPDEDFESLQKLGASWKNQIQVQMKGEPSQCSVTVELNRCILYRNRFSKMADLEFKKRVWSHFNQIVAIDNELLGLDKDSENMKRIERICKEYGQLLVFNARVAKQCKSPKNISDRWSNENVKDIFNSVPNASAPVTNTDLYANTRRDKVEARICPAHINYVNDFYSLCQLHWTTDSTADCNQVIEQYLYPQMDELDASRGLYNNAQHRSTIKRQWENMLVQFKCDKN